MIASPTTLFPVWAIGFAAFAYVWPDPFVALKPIIAYLLGVVMFGMGVTLTPANFTEILRRPQIVALGVSLQYLIMPFLAWGISVALKLSPALTAGMVLVGASPGGTASNVICYLARGDLALSITLTAVSTLLAVVATPFLSLVYLGKTVDVPAVQMFFDLFEVVLLPVAAGAIINRVAHAPLKRLKQLFPLLSVAVIGVIIGIVVALNKPNIHHLSGVLVAAVVLHNLLGLALGYVLPRLMGQNARICRTLAIEVGMQNSGLAVALTTKYFSAIAALPGAMFSIWHNVSGSLLAARWSRTAD